MSKWLVVRAWLVEADTAGDAMVLGEPGEHFRNVTQRLDGLYEYHGAPDFDVVIQPIRGDR